MSDDLKKWDKVDRVHEVILRVRVQETTERDRLRFAFNGKELPQSLLRKINQMYVMDAPRYRVFGYWYVFRLHEKFRPVQGGMCWRSNCSNGTGRRYRLSYCAM